MYDPNQNDPNQNYPQQNYPNQMNPYQNYPMPTKSEGSALAGFGIAIGAHFIFQPLISILGAIPKMEFLYFSVFYIGLSQLVYMIPAIIIAFSKGKPQLGKGLLIGAGITFLLNAACMGLIFVSFRT